MKFLFSLVFLFILKTGALAQFTNIQISNNDSPNEPSICLDPKNPNRIVAGSNINNMYYSSDGGITWTEKKMISNYGVWGDPAIGVDTTGAFYFFHLSNPAFGSWIDRIVCQKSTDGGANWSDGTFTGLNGAKAQDKHWMAVDRNKNYLYLTWTQFDNYGSNVPQDSSIIMFSKSTDGGENWSPALRINKQAGDCIDSDQTVEGATPCVGPNGEIYVAWAGPNGLMFDRSLDEGATWLAEDIQIDDFPGGWDYTIHGIYRCNGLPVTACDLSGSAYHGTIYAHWSDQRNGTGDTDLWLSKSSDGGNTWSGPKRINDDGPGKQQFMSWMAIDQATGYLWFVFYDRRSYNNDKTDVYIAVSTDGGEHFLNYKISQNPFTPSTSNFFGDYTNITVHNNQVHPIWTRMNSGQTSIWTAAIDGNLLISKSVEIPNTNQDEISEAVFPNPADLLIQFPYKVRRDGPVSLWITDENGKNRAVIMDKKFKPYGRYAERIDCKKLGLTKGKYWINLLVDGKTSTQLLLYSGE